MTRNNHIKMFYFYLLIAIASQSAIAEENAGTLMQKMSQPAPVAPTNTTQKANTNSTKHTDKKQEKATVMLKQLIFEGNHKISSEALRNAIKLDPEKKYDYDDLQNFCRTIEQYYNKSGYLLVYAWLPPQKVSQGILKISIIEARIDKITLDNPTKLSNRLVKPLLYEPGTENPIQDDGSISNVLYQLNNYPGISAQAAYSASKTPGATDINVVLKKQKPYDFNINVDSRNVGRLGVGARFVLNNPLGQADQLSAYAMSSGRPLNYATIDYNFALTAYGTRLGTSASILAYDNTDDKDFSALGNTGNAKKLTLYMSQPLYQKIGQQLTLGMETSRNILKDSYKTTKSHNDRHLNSMTLSLNHSYQKNTYYIQTGLSCTLGSLQYDDPIAEALDQSGAKRAGGYSLCNLNLNYQYLFAQSNNVIKFNLSTQYSPSKLDSNAQFNLNGVNVAGGDSGYQASLSWIKQISQQWQGTVALSHSHVYRRDDKSKFSVNNLTTGINWQSQNGWLLGVNLGWPFAASDGQKRKAQLNLTVNKTF